MTLHPFGRRPLLPLLALAALAAGCAVGQPGKNDTSYYYSNRQGRSSVAPVVAHPAPAPRAPGPQGVARIVYFDFDKSEVQPEYRSVVQAHADYLRSRPQASVVLEGHTDSRGGREYNLSLGQRRADAVARQMRLGGADGARINTMSWGMERPASTESTEAGYQLNRRVEFVYR